ncbi:hypothetical protein KKP91_02035 [Methanothermococcus sp. SCGC AD-155-M21]|nr:hypothetical protein [Methanothermococcus sp. SCGC AD-155-M21]
MDSKKLIKRILNDTYKNLDEYSKDLIRSCDFEVIFKDLYIIEKNTGNKKTLEHLEDCESLPSFEAQEQEYILKKVNLDNSFKNIIEIVISSEASERGYILKVDDNYKVIMPNRYMTYEHRERILEWTELSEEELDKKLEDFYEVVDKGSEDLKKLDSMEYCNFMIYTDVFMDLDVIENIVERDNDMIIIWIHPLYLFSSEIVIKGIIAYELSSYNNKIIEEYYREIIEYCKEYKKLLGKNLNILKKIRDIALKSNDKEAINLINEIEGM